MKLAFAIFTSLAGLFFMYAATTAVPDLGYPTTPREWVATQLVVVGILLHAWGMGLLALLVRK